MAIRKMMLVNIIGRVNDLIGVLDACTRDEHFHIEKTLSYVSDDGKYTAFLEDNPYAVYYEKLRDLAGRSLVELTHTDCAELEIPDGEIRQFIDETYEKLDTLGERRRVLNEKLNQTEFSINSLGHFTNFDLHLGDIFSCQYIKVRFGRIPNESFEKLKLYNNNPYIIFFPCQHDNLYHWGVYFSPIDKVNETDRIFANLYFERLRLPDAVGTPEETIEEYKRIRDGTEEELAGIDRELSQFWESGKEHFLRVYAYICKKHNSYKLRSYAAKFKEYFHIMGFIPADCTEAFGKRMEMLEAVEYTVDPPDKKSKLKPPVKLKNNIFARPYEMYVEMYGLPSYSEVDPTPFVALTYSILFGIMFADLGQGLALILAGFLMSRLKGMQLGRILMRTGVFSALFGTLFGSVFGFEHALDEILFKNMLGLHEKPFEVMGGNNIVTIIISAVGIGVFLLIACIAINIYTSFKQKKWEAAIVGHNGIAGLIFYVSAVALGVTPFVSDINLFTPLFIIPCLVLPVIIMFLHEPLGHLMEGKKDWIPEKKGEFILQNFFEMFEVLLSYITNTMSFLRVGAFVLVHAGMMLVVFTLAEMVGGAGYIIVIIFGNVFVCGLEGLLVGIQSLRLEFYEMFSRFFAGDGKPFAPVKN